MKKFLYETHVHTSETSPCGKATAEDTVLFYKEKGFTGIIMTDHLKCAENESLSKDEWKKFVDEFTLGYRLAYEVGEKVGLQVFFAWEYTVLPFGGTDFLTYGLDMDWLYEHNEIAGMSIGDYCDYVREAGAFVSHAHPYREAHYIKMIRLVPRKVDAAEVYNANRKDFENERADDFANVYDLIKTAGTDNHMGSKQVKLGGMAFDEKLKDINHFVEKVRAQEFENFKMEV